MVIYYFWIWGVMCYVYWVGVRFYVLNVFVFGLLILSLSFLDFLEVILNEEERWDGWMDGWIEGKWMEMFVVCGFVVDLFLEGRDVEGGLLLLLLGMLMI